MNKSSEMIFKKLQNALYGFAVFTMFAVSEAGASEGNGTTDDAVTDKKVFEYKIAYPKFDYKGVQQEAEKEYKKADINSRVNVTQMLNGIPIDVSGVYYGSRGKRAVIGSKEIPFTYIFEGQRHLFDEDFRQEKIRNYVNDKFKTYNKKKSDDIADFKERLLKDRQKISQSKDKGADAGNAVAANTEKVPKSRTADTGEGNRNGYGILLKSIPEQGIKAGEIVVVEMQKEKVKCRLRGSEKSFSTDAGNVRIFKEGSFREEDFKEPLLISQLAMEQMLAGNVACAYNLADSEAMSPFQTGRIGVIRKLIKEFFELYKTASSANKQMKDLEEQFDKSRKKLEANKTVMNDEFARKAGAADRRDEISADMEKKEKEINSVEASAWKQINEFFSRWRNESMSLANGGDFVLAASVSEFLKSNKNNFCELVKKGRKNISGCYEEDFQRDMEYGWTWSSLERQMDNAFKEERLNSQIVELMEMHTKIFSMKDMAQILEKFVNRMSKDGVAADESKNSFDYTYKYFSAVNSNDFGEQMSNGLRLLLLMPNVSFCETVKKNLKDRLNEYSAYVDKSAALYNEKKYTELLSESINLKPLPPMVLKWRDDAGKEMDKSVQLCKKAKSIASQHPVSNSDEIISCIEEAVKIWPCNTEAQGFKKEFFGNYEKLCRGVENISKFISENAFDDAVKELETLKKDYQTDKEPDAFAKLETKIGKAREHYGAELKKADNYTTAKNYGEALKIYDKLKADDKKKLVYEGMFEEARNARQWEKAVALLEKLERWQEAGTLRSENKITGKVFLREKTYSASEVFEKCKSSVVTIYALYNYRLTMTGSGFAVTGDGMIITNKHVIKARGVASKITVKHPDWDKTFEATVISIAEKKDLALLKISNAFPVHLDLVKDVPPVGSKVYALGNPGGLGESMGGDILTLTFTEGIISNAKRTFDGNNCVQTTATINHGNSGGPLLDESGLVVGINTFGLSEAGIANTFFAIKAEEAIECFKQELNIDKK